MKISIPKLPILFEFILFISFVEVFFFTLLNNLGFQAFQLVPYLRIFVILFTLLFILKRIKFSFAIFSISLKNSIENKLMLIWLLISIISLIVGVLRLNPILYLFTDFFYIIIGYLLFRIVSYKNNGEVLYYKLTQKQELFFITFVIILTTIATFFLQIVSPSFLVIFTMCYSLYLFIEKRHKLSILYLLPFILQLVAANRALILVFIVLLFFSFTVKKVSRKNIIVFFIVTLLTISLIIYFLDDIFGIIIELLDDSSKLRSRLVQLRSVFNGRINWNTPSALSLKQRLVEINLVVEFWLSNVFNFIFGGGLGATLDGSSFKDKGVVASAILGKQNIHNIHVLPFSIILRYGLMGILFLLFLIKLVLRYFKTILFKENRHYLPLYLFVFSWILYSIPAASYLWTTPLFWLILSINSNADKN